MASKGPSKSKIRAAEQILRSPHPQLHYMEVPYAHVLGKSFKPYRKRAQLQ